MSLPYVLLLSTLLTAPQGGPATDADRDGIKRAALDYAEGWYEGNAEKMERALHPDLAKRIVQKDQRGTGRVNHMSALTLVQYTRQGGGKSVPASDHVKDVKILDVMENSASVKLEMRDWVDYLHVGKVNGRWVVINVLWEMKPRKTEGEKK